MAERRAIVYEIEVETEIEEDGAGGPEDLDLQRLCLGILWPSSVRTCMRSRSRPRSSVFATTLPFQLTLPILRSAGPRKEGALVCSKDTNLGPAQQSSAGLLHFERWQGNWIHREPQATENPVTRFPSGGNMHNDSIGKNRYSYDESRNLSSKCL